MYFLPKNLPNSAIQVIGSVLNENDVLALYLYGSYANGYEEPDSDFDIVAITRSRFSVRAEKRNDCVEVHYVSRIFEEEFDVMHPYGSLRMMPISNPEYVSRISRGIKKELVKRECKSLASKSRRKQEELIFSVPDSIPIEVDILFPIRNFLIKQVLERPWRMAPFERILRSKKTWEILKEEYRPIFGELVADGVLYKEHDSYFINPQYVFVGQTSKVPHRFSWIASNSRFGLYYLINLHKIHKYRQEVI